MFKVQLIDTLPEHFTVGRAILTAYLSIPNRPPVSINLTSTKNEMEAAHLPASAEAARKALFF